MRKILTFDFLARNESLAESAGALPALLDATTPWLDGFQVWNEPRPRFHGTFGGTLWGSDEPWNTADGMEKIAAASHRNTVQDMQFEFMFPLAMAELAKSHHERLAGRLVLFPMLSGAWNGSPSRGILVTLPRQSDHERANDHAYRTAKAFSLAFRTDGGKPSLGAGYLFPIKDSGQDVPQHKNALYLQIHR